MLLWERERDSEGGREGGRERERSERGFGEGGAGKEGKMKGGRELGTGSGRVQGGREGGVGRDILGRFLQNPLQPLTQHGFWKLVCL